jgi:type IV pilus assembly protein PilB
MSTQKDFDMEKIAQAIANCLGLPYFDLKSISQANILTDIFDPNFIQLHRVLPFCTDQKQLYLAISELSHSDIINEIKFYTDLSIHPVVTEANKLLHLIDNYLYNQRNQQLQDLHEFSEIGLTDDQRLISFLHNIICDAIQKKASDIHFEPYKTTYRIRTRIDGILHKTLQIPNSLANRITARLIKSNGET